MEYSDKQIQIMEAAEMLFAEKGFNGTSVRDISEKAHVNLAMISYYFGSKDKLLEALFHFRGETMKMKLESIIEQPGVKAIDKVNLLIEHYIDKIMNQQCFHRIMAREQVVNHTGVTAELIMQMKRQNQALIKKLVAEGQNSGEFNKDIDVPLMIATLIGTVNHLVTTKHYYRELNDLQSVSEEDFQALIRNKLTNHLKRVFKAILVYEA